MDRLPVSPNPEELLRQADETEQLAKLVSYGPDKARLQQQASELRKRARHAPSESRSWTPKEGGPRKR